MKPIVKQIAISVGLILLGSILVGYNKVQQISKQIYDIAIAPSGVRKIKFGLKEISFVMDVILKNNSGEDFYVNGSIVATLKRLEIMYNGNKIGVAHTNISELSIPAYGTTLLKDLPVTIVTEQLLVNFANAQDIINNFEIIGYIDVIGNEFQIGA